VNLTTAETAKAWFETTNR